MSAGSLCAPFHNCSLLFCWCSCLLYHQVYKLEMSPARCICPQATVNAETFTHNVVSLLSAIHIQCLTTFSFTFLPQIFTYLCQEGSFCLLLPNSGGPRGSKWEWCCNSEQKRKRNVFCNQITRRRNYFKQFTFNLPPKRNSQKKF